MTINDLDNKSIRDYTDIVPIPTKYNGYTFRSRLEARWAVFFDIIGVKYEYEKQVYNLPSGMYLPDFYLPDITARRTIRKGVWLEIKPTEPTDEEGLKCNELAGITQIPYYIFVGEPGEFGEESGYEYSVNDWESFCNSRLSYGWMDNEMRFCKCYNCGHVKIEYNEGNYMHCPICGKECRDNHPLIIKGYIESQTKKFVEV
jgi:hypothetical protein